MGCARICLCTGLWFFLTAWSAPAAETNTYSLAECIKIGLERSTVLENARRGESIADATIEQATAQALPRITLSAKYTRLDKLQEMNLGGDTPTALGTLDNYSVLGEASQLLYSGGKVDAAIEAARLYKNLARHGTAATQGELTRDIKTGFYGLLMAGEAVKVREESLEQVKAYLEMTQKKFEAGKASEFDLLTAKVRQGNELPSLLTAVNALKLAKERYRVLLNLDDTPFELAGKLEYEPVSAKQEKLFSTALANRPAVRQAETRIALMAQDVIVAKAAYQPSVNVVADYNGANSYQFASFGDNIEWHWNASLVASWDLWDGGLRSATLRQKRLDLASEQARRSELWKLVSLEVRQACLEIEQAEELIKANKGNVELAEKGLSIAGTRYDSGSATYMELLDANLACNLAKLNYKQALYSYNVALAQLEFACGTEMKRERQDGR